MSERDDLEEKFFKPAHDNRPAEPICYGCGVSHAVADLVEGKAAADLLADARALWAVRVLDAWASTPNGLPLVTCPSVKGGWVASDPNWQDEMSEWRGETPDAARLAAAEAVYPELPESVRAGLGARP